LLSQGLGSWIARRARVTPDNIAMTFEDQKLTYLELQQRVARVAAAFSSLGIRRGDRMGYLGPNHPSFIETMFAAWSLGAIFVPINFRLSEQDLLHIMNDAGCSLLVYDSNLADSVEPLRMKIPLSHYVQVGSLSNNAKKFEELAKAGNPSERIEKQTSLDDICMIVYTSGTTGLPKGVMLTHANITWNVYNMLSATSFTDEDVTLAWAPLFRMGGLAVTVLETLHKGGRVVIVNQTETRQALKIIEQHKVTVVFSGPELCASLAQLSEFDTADLSSVRVWITGGAPVPEPLIRLYQARNIPFQQGYGLTEASPVVLLLSKEDSIRKVGSAGKPVFFTDIRVVRPDMTDVATGEIGELLVQGPNVMKGYWNQPEATNETIVDGVWLRTGDAARLDEEGYVYIVDRIRDTFISGGERVFPSQVESVINQHPKVSECAVAGIAGAGTGLTGIAFVVLKKEMKCSGDELLEFCRDRLIPSRLPRAAVFVDELPKNPAGKVLRNKLLANMDISLS
jgi:fatty-acyl-CoA synthase